MTSNVKLTLAIVFFTALGLGIAYLAGQSGHQYKTMSAFFICALWAYGLNWLAYIPAAIFKTEKYYDLMGSLTYLSTFAMAAYLSQPLGLRAMVVAGLVGIWAIRLGSFLFARISRDKHDKRFEKIKTNPVRFFLTWTLQGTWVVLTSACALAILTSHHQTAWDMFATIGLVMWVIGFAIEVSADNQKSRFRKNPDNKDKYITTGLWSRSQHPNYFGEIFLWCGIAVMALPVLSGWGYLSLISPLFVTFLLTRVSGIPMLQRAGLKKWGNDPDYIAYRERTPKLIPKLT